MLKWIRLSALAVLGWVMACGCTLGMPATIPTSQAPTSTPLGLVSLATLTPTKTTAPIIATSTPFPTQIPRATAIPLPVIPNRGSYGNACVVLPAKQGDTINVRVGAGTNYGVIALLQTWAVIITSQGSWYAIELPKGLTQYEVGWVSNTVTIASAGCYAPTPQPPIPTPTENTICRFIVGGNVSTVTLYTAPNGPFGATVPTQTLTILAQQGNWFQVISSVTGQSGWLPDNQGYLLGNCSFIPQITPVPSQPQSCLITIGIDSPVYSSPNEPSIDGLLAGTVVQPIVRTDSGWWGYKQGVTSYSGQDLKTLAWVPYGNPLGNVNVGTPGCSTLPLVVYPAS